MAAHYHGKPRLFIVPADTAGLSFAAPNRPWACVQRNRHPDPLDNVKLDHNALLGGEHSDFHYRDFLDLGQLHWCALATGTCQAALDYLIPYCNEREAFGEPISHRPVRWPLCWPIWPLSWNPCVCLPGGRRHWPEQGKEFHREAYLAHILCAEKAMEIGTNAVQLLGGHGFTKEHPAERWYRDLRVLGCINSGLHL